MKRSKNIKLSSKIYEYIYILYIFVNCIQYRSKVTVEQIYCFVQKYFAI